MTKTYNVLMKQTSKSLIQIDIKELQDEFATYELIQERIIQLLSSEEAAHESEIASAQLENMLDTKASLSQTVKTCQVATEAEILQSDCQDMMENLYNEHLS